MRLSIAAAAFLATAASASQVVYQTEEVTITSCAEKVKNCPAQSTVTSITSYPVPVVDSYPVITPVNSYPVVNPVKSSPVVNPVNSYPVVNPVNSYPAVNPVNSYPVVNPVNSYPAVNPVKSYPIITPASSAPVVHPTATTQAKVSNPAATASASLPLPKTPSPPGHETPYYPVYKTSSAMGIFPSAPASPPPPVLKTITISTCVPTVIYSVVTGTPSRPAFTPASSVTRVFSYPHNVTYPTATGVPHSPQASFTGAASNVQGSMVITVALAGLAAFMFA